ncbi:hypothetical protein VNO80_06856 [Phaseolus coccineus]|uniref:P-type ATPase N-terminal domain-containing protein n=1 Tax=Phaseolus coccineus TaxID=3886 RepID=A0AAN9NN05_PHACN
MEESYSLQGPRFSCTMYCNQPLTHEKEPLYFCRNDISTTRYDVLKFFPKALFEYFHRVANINFLLDACLSTSPISPLSPLRMIASLAFVVGLSMEKEALEDSCRSWQNIMSSILSQAKELAFKMGNTVELYGFLTSVTALDVKIFVENFTSKGTTG